MGFLLHDLTNEMQLVVHQCIRAVMARKCGGTDAPGPAMNRTASAAVEAREPQNWNSSPAALRWSVAGLLFLNSRWEHTGMVARW